MKNKEQFDNSIKVLVKAYLEGVLKHTHPCACAVGNLIAACNNYSIINKKYGLQWETETGRDAYINWMDERGKNYTQIPEIKATGYSIPEIVQIEKAFEQIDDVPSDTDGYKGLCAVCDVLFDIHKGSDKQLKLAKDRLIKA